MCEGVMGVDSFCVADHHVVGKTHDRLETKAGATTAERESPTASSCTISVEEAAMPETSKRFFTSITTSVTTTAIPKDAPTAENKPVVVEMEDVPCFPACMQDDNQKAVKIVAAGGDDDAEAATPRAGRRSRRNSRRLSMDNQRDSMGDGPSFDLEDVAQGVLSPVDYRTQAAPPGSIVVDYDEGMPVRSRTALLRDATIDLPVPPPVDCAPTACNPLDLLAFEELSIDDGVAKDRIRPRLGSASQPKTPSGSRRGKSVVLSSTSVPVAPIEPVAVAKKPSTTKKAQEEEPIQERCSTLHKLCLCEVRLHKSTESCWLVANNSVYDVTGLLSSHPAGPRSILRKAGGTDCTKDMKFHSKSARNMLEKCFIGKLVACGPDPVDGGDSPACTIM